MSKTEDGYDWPCVVVGPEPARDLNRRFGVEQAADAVRMEFASNVAAGPNVAYASVIESVRKSAFP